MPIKSIRTFSFAKSHGAHAALIVLIFSLVFPKAALPTDLIFAYPAFSSSQAIYWVTYELGLFKKHNLDVQLVYIGFGPTVTQALLSGNLKITGGAAVAAVRSNLSGADTVMVANFLPTIPYTLVARSEIRNPKDLVGKSVGINAFGGTLDMVARYFLERLSLKPVGEVALRVVAGQSTERIIAMKNGIVDAVVLDIPNVPVAERFGGHVLIDMLKLEKPLPYPFATTMTTRSYIMSNPNEVRAVTRALIEGVYHFKTRKSDTMRIMGKYLRTNDAKFLTDTYAFSSKLLQQVPSIPTESIRNVLHQISVANPEVRDKIKQTDPQSFIDMQFVKEAEEDGFVANLYKGR